jgi:hypothetical protein
LAIAGAASLSLVEQGRAIAQSVSADQARAIAKEAYVYGFPLVDLYRINWGYFVDRGGPAYKGSIDTLVNVPNVYTPADTTVQTPNSDTPYSFALFDLRAEPWVITLPAIEASRYYAVQIIDLYTYNSYYLGTRTTGNGGGDFLLAGPNWRGTAPSGIKKAMIADTDLMLAGYRTQLFGPSDLENVRKVQAGYKIAPLSKYANSTAPSAAAPIHWIPPITPAEERTSLEFFNILAWVLQYCPTFPNEIALRGRFASLGIEPGKAFNAKGLSSTLSQAMAAGMADGQKEIDAKRATVTNTNDYFGTRQQLGTNYLNRAVAAQYGILGNSAAEAVYLPYEKDSGGKPLSGATAYTLRFGPGELPPVNAFWSVTMYDLPQQLLVANSINRYLINSPMLPQMKKDPDGGYTLYIQNASPGAEKESNWLPAPKGPFFLILRCYYPKEAVINGTWKQPPLHSA